MESDGSLDPEPIDADELLSSSEEEQYESFAVNRQSMTLKATPMARILPANSRRLDVLNDIVESDGEEGTTNYSTTDSLPLPDALSHISDDDQELSGKVIESFPLRLSLMEMQGPTKQEEKHPVSPTVITSIKKRPSLPPPPPPARRSMAKHRPVLVADGRKSTGVIASIPNSPKKKAEESKSPENKSTLNSSFSPTKKLQAPSSPFSQSSRSYR